MLKQVCQNEALVSSHPFFGTPSRDLKSGFLHSSPLLATRAAGTTGATSSALLRAAHHVVVLDGLVGVLNMGLKRAKTVAHTNAESAR